MERVGIRLAPGLTLQNAPGVEYDREWIEQERFGLLHILAVDDDEGDPLLTVPGIARIDGKQADDEDCYSYVVRVLARAARRGERPRPGHLSFRPRGQRLPG